MRRASPERGGGAHRPQHPQRVVQERLQESQPPPPKSKEEAAAIQVKSRNQLLLL